MDVFYPETKKWERITHSQALNGLANLKKTPAQRLHTPLPRASTSGSATAPTAKPSVVLRPSSLSVGSSRFASQDVSMNGGIDGSGVGLGEEDHGSTDGGDDRGDGGCEEEDEEEEEVWSSAL